MNQKVDAIYKESIRTLTKIYDEREASSIINLLFEDLLNISRIQRLTQPQQILTDEQSEKLESALESLTKGVPLQHITGFTYFLDRRFFVNAHTLIPRPETEELVELVIRENEHLSGLRILDIGTGSGCIPISLSLALNQAKIWSWDIAEEAIKIARKNAKALNAEVILEHKDVLSSEPTDYLDIIVSNPPYIPEGEKASMHINVTDHEPAIALFVPDSNPLKFYQRISMIGLKKLNPQGKLYFEIHESYGQDVKTLLQKLGYLSVEILQDLNGKDRMVRATMPPQ